MMSQRLAVFNKRIGSSTVATDQGIITQRRGNTAAVSNRRKMHLRTNITSPSGTETTTAGKTARFLAVGNVMGSSFQEESDTHKNSERIFPVAKISD
jgi:hypothetical protein